MLLCFGRSGYSARSYMAARIGSVQCASTQLAVQTEPGPKVKDSAVVGCDTYLITPVLYALYDPSTRKDHFAGSVQGQRWRTSLVELRP
jgi:hypothetical protein